MIQEIHTRRGLEWNSDEQQLPYILSFIFILLNWISLYSRLCLNPYLW